MSHSARALAALVSLVLLAPLGAQDVEIVVTATKEPTPAQTLPVGVSVLDAEDLAASSTVAEALSRTLAVRLDTLAAGQSTLGALGFGENGFGRVSLLVDGFSMANPDMRAPSLATVPLFALEKIEVVSAGAPALYGSGSVAGVVNLVTKTPTDLEAQVSTTLESTLTNRQSLAASLPWGPGALLVSFTRDQNLPSRDDSDSDSYQAWVQGRLPWTQGGLDHEVRMWVSLVRDEVQFPGSLLTDDYREDPTAATNQDDSGVQTETKALGAWSVWGDSWSVTVPGSVVYRVGKTTLASQFSYTESSTVQGSFSPRFEATLGQWAADWTLSGGLDGTAVRLGVDRFFDDDFESPYLRASVDRWSGALWGRLAGSWNQTLHPSAALRWEGVHTQVHSDDSPAINHQRSFAPVSGQVGLTWTPTKGSRVGAEVARVYRVPFTDEMVSYWGDSGYGNSDTFLDLDPETGWSAALTSGWTSDLAGLDASGSVVTMADEIVYDTSTGANTNLGRTLHVVGRLKGELRPVGGLTLGSEYSYEWAEQTAGDFDGKALPLVPSHRARFWTQYGGSWGLVDGQWTLTGGFFKGGDQANELSKVPGAQSLNLGVTAYLGSPDLRLRVYGTNLTDDRTPTSVFYSVYSGNTGWYPLEGRVFGATLIWEL